MIGTILQRGSAIAAIAAGAAGAALFCSSAGLTQKPQVITVSAAAPVKPPVPDGPPWGPPWG
jgi:hypothetical protein